MYKDCHKDQDQTIAQAFLHLSILSVTGKGHTEHALRAHLKGMLYYQEPRAKKKTFLGKTPFFGKMLTFLGHFCAKLCTESECFHKMSAY